MGYKILRDYGTEGFQFDDEEYESIDAAVKDATKMSYGSPFLIVKIVDWEAKELPEKLK